MIESPSDEQLRNAIKVCTEDRDANMLTYSGPIYANNVNSFIVYALTRRVRNNLVLVLTTYGGDAHAAYRLGRFLQEFFGEIRLIVVGPCKSAGTLVTLAANELAFGPFGELGPLDIQVTKKDDLMSVGSGLDTLEALAILKQETFSTFQTYFDAILKYGEGAISTTTAAEIASRLVAGLLGPLSAQIDPQKMGEMERQISIAKAYGDRLGLENLKPGALDRLVRDYTSHGFIIDYKEAQGLFVEVSKATSEEFLLTRELHRAGTCVLFPTNETIFGDVRDLLPKDVDTDEDSENEAVKGNSGRIEDTPPDSGGPGEPKPRSRRNSRGKPNGAPPEKRRKREGSDMAV